MDIELKHIKAFIAAEKEAIDEATHSILFTIPETVDRSDEIVTAKAIYEAIIDKKTFAANPICLPCHQHRLDGGEPPCVGSWDVESAKLLKNAVNIRLNFAVGTKLGDEYWNCYSKKHMRAISIGFHPEESHVEDRGGNPIKITTAIEMYEISCVSIGCNTGALSKLKSQFGWEEKEGVPQNAKEYLDGKFKELQDSILQQIEDLKTLIFPEPDELAKALLRKETDESPVPAEKIEDAQIDDEQLKEVFKELKN